jgi:Mg-chelatase subunit ChlD
VEVLRSSLFVLSLFALVPACATPDDAQPSVVVSHLGQTQPGRFGGTISVVDESGTPIAKNTNGVTVETRAGNGPWRPATNVSLGNGPPLLDVMIVADNSGSTRDELTEVKDALHHMAHVILTREPPDRVGLIRVSTVATVLAQPSTELAPIDTAIDGMFVTNGWTALWDGVRLGRDTLAASQIEQSPTGECYPARAPSVLVYTDGQENNSADEHMTSYSDESDGIDTTFDDLTQLTVDGTPVAIYTVAIGSDADRAGLAALADATGGRHVDIANDGGLVGALHGAAAQLSDLIPFCFTPVDCADTEARITVTQGNQQFTHVVTLAGCAP